MHAWPQNDADIAAAQRFRLSHKVLRAHSAFQAASFVLTPQRHEADLLLVGDPAQPAGRVLDLAGLSGRRVLRHACTPVVCSITVLISSTSTMLHMCSPVQMHR